MEWTGGKRVWVGGEGQDELWVRKEPGGTWHGTFGEIMGYVVKERIRAMGHAKHQGSEGSLPGLGTAREWDIGRTGRWIKHLARK